MSKETEKSVFAQIFLDKEARLSKKSWHYKLLKFVLGEQWIPQYNFCPYFWLTMFAVCISPIVIPIKLVILTFLLFFEMGAKFIDFVIISPIEKIKVKQIERCPDKIFAGYLYLFDDFWNIPETSDKKYLFTISERNFLDSYRSTDAFLKWRKQTPDWEEKIAAWKKQREQDYEGRKARFDEMSKQLDERIRVRESKKAEEQRKINKRNAKIKNLMIILGKILVPFLIIPVALVVYGLYLVIVYLIRCLVSVSLETWFNFAIVFGVVIGLLVVAFLIGLFIKYVALKISEWSHKEGDCHSFKEETPSVIRQLLSRIFGSIKAFFSGLIEGIGFFVVFFKNWKSDNCPEIKWEDEENK